MKKDDFLKKLSDLTGLEATKIAEVVTSESDEIEGIELPQLHVFTEDELADRLINHVNKSAPTIIEKAIKEERNKIKEKFDITFEGKTIDNLVTTAIEAGKKQAGVKPNEKITELEGVIKTLQGNMGKVEEEWKGKYNDLENQHKTIKRNLQLKSIIPTDLDTTLSHDKILALFNMDIQTDEENGKMIFKDANGNQFRDEKTQNPLSEKEVVNIWLEQNNFKRKDPEGRGGDNDHGKKYTNVANIATNDDFYNYCKSNNIPQRDYGKTLVEIQKVNPNFRLT